MNRPLIIMILLAWCAEAFAAGGIVPESGTYWSPRRDGEGAFVDYQNGNVTITLFSYDAQGRPVYYFAAGPTQLAPQTEAAIAGLYPMRVLRADLFRSENGPIFNAAGARQLETTRVGRLFAEFSAVGSVYLEVTLTTQPPEGSMLNWGYVMSRFNFGFPQYGTQISSQFQQACWRDLRGDWVFVDQTDPQRPAWRFSFGPPEITPGAEGMVCRQAAHLPPQILSYRDPARGATLRCIYASSQNPDPLDGRAKNHCDLRLDGQSEPLFWFAEGDMGLKRISASLGAVRSDALRTADRVVGIRVE